MTRCITNLNNSVSAFAGMDRFHSGTVIVGLWAFSVWCSINLANLWWFSERSEQVWLFIQFLKNTALLLSWTHINTIGPKVSWVYNLQQKIMQDLRFSQQCYWRSKFSGKWHCVVKKTVPTVSKDSNTFTFRVKQSILLELLYPKDESTTILQNTGNSRKLESSTQYNIQWNWITTF